MNTKSIIIISLLLFNVLGGGRTQVKNTSSPSADTTEIYYPTGTAAADSLHSKLIGVVDRKADEIREGLKQERAQSSAEIAFWKKQATTAQKDLAELKARPNDTIFLQPTYPIIRTIYKGLVPIPSKSLLPLHVKFGRQPWDIKKMFRDSIRIEDDTANLEFVRLYGIKVLQR